MTTASRSEFSSRLLLFVIVVLFYWKLVFTYQYDWISGPDMAQQVLPWYEEASRQIQHGLLPVWDTHSWGGQPLLGQGQPGIAYPLNWPLWLIPRQQGHIFKWALQWYYVLIHYMAALFCFTLCRDVGRGRAASLIGGLVFGLAGYIGSVEWPQKLNGAVWAPLVIMFVLRAARGLWPIRNAAFAGLCLGLSWLSGHHEAPIFITLATGGLWIYYIFRNTRPDWRIAGLASVAMALAFFIGAVQILPAQEYGHLSLRWAPDPLHWYEPVPYSEHQNLAFYASSLLGFIFPGMHRNADPFIGAVALGLAIMGVTLAWKRPLVKVFTALAIGGLLYALGHQSVFQGIIYAVLPWVEKARTSSHSMLISQVGTAVLAAYGIDSILSAGERAMRVIIAAVCAFGVLTFTILFGVMAVKKLGWDTDDRLFLTPFLALLFAALLHAWRTRNIGSRAAQVLLALLILQELGNNAGYMLHPRAQPDRFLESSTANSEIADYLRNRPGHFRADSAVEDIIIGNWGDYHDVDMFHSYLAGATENVLSFDHGSWETAMLMGIRYTLAPKPTHDGQADIFWGARGIHVYENAQVFPRAWSVHQLFSLANPKEANEFIEHHLDELRSKAFLMNSPAPRLESCGGQDAVTLTSYKPSSVSIHANMNCAGMLVLSDTYYPGWRARVDGRPAEIREVDLALRGVMVPKGSHDVTFSYLPWSIIAGATMTLIGVFAVVVLASRSR